MRPMDWFCRFGYRFNLAVLLKKQRAKPFTGNGQPDFLVFASFANFTVAKTEFSMVQ
jgi:hypothetical protein